MEKNKFYLTPTDSRKSFYNKCYVEQIGNIATLYSYNTKICSYNTETKELEKFYAYDYSMTTKRHQNAFFKFYNISA